MSNIANAIESLKRIAKEINKEDLNDVVEMISDFTQIEKEEHEERERQQNIRCSEVVQNAELLLRVFDECGMVNQSFVNAVEGVRNAVKEYRESERRNFENFILCYEARRESDGLTMCSAGTLQDVKDYLCREYHVEDYREAPCYIVAIHDHEKECMN